ncbi:unnamed protein product [Mytilus coruscus]|uniref:DSBA-like thioredoxin domain-containing protein n=1 Tax=Mytilus coruscus TaxID=42192 RepID=A0A6J8A5H8_MYTCO|nr:unnamed protein product [Mytilus coruscus]
MELAMNSLKDKIEFRVRWEPFLLNPNSPADGSPKPASYTDPSNPRVAMLRKTGEALGIEMYNQPKVFPSTLKAHTLLEFVKSKNGGEQQNDVAERLFKKYFSEADTLKEDSLLSVAKEFGFDENEAKSFIDNQQENVYQKALMWSNKGISGVPAFYMNGHKMFSGAQEPDAFKRMFEIAAEKFPLQSSKT